MMFKIRKNIKSVILTILTIFDAMFSEFFLGDIVFTFLPIGIIALVDYALGKLSSDIWMIQEWPFSCIMISSLALTKSLELKVFYQKDNISRVLILTRLCIILIIASVISLFLSIFRQQVSAGAGDNFIKEFQFYILILWVFTLFFAHLEKEVLIFKRREFPIFIRAGEFHCCLIDNLNEAKEKIHASYLAINKEYNFFKKNEDWQLTGEYKKQELKKLVEDIQNDLNKFKQRLDDWNKPPYHSAIPPEQQQDESL